MFKIRCALRRLGREESGNIAVLFGFLAVPLLLLMGGAVDVARHTRYKTALSNSVDSAALALARQGGDYSAAEATDFVANYLSAYSIADDHFAVQSPDVEKLDNGFLVTVDGTMRTIFLPIGKLVDNGAPINSWGVNVVAEVVTSSNRLELALVLDNTGSMNCSTTVTSGCVGNWNNPSSSSRIVGLKKAANTLINIVMKAENNDPDLVKVAVVPFEGTVNTGYSSNDVPSWIEWNDVASSRWDGLNFEKRNTGSGAECTSGSNCRYVGHKWLFDNLNAKYSSLKWEGCVEMRAAPYDTLDTPPTSANPDTLFVPFFWPDEPDSNNDSGDYYQNNYLNDQGSFNTGRRRNSRDDPAGAQMSWEKYFPSGRTSNIRFQSGAPDTSFPFENGPNYGCPRPIVPLTSTKSLVTNAIDNLVAYPAMGTYISTGLSWGWHVLSADEPFTQGVGPSSPYFDKTVKAMVLLTDGENSVTGTSNHNGSIFSAYNYVNTADAYGDYHLGSSNTASAEAKLNDNTATLCANVKSAKIRLYTITFGSIPSSAKTLMRNCASVDKGETLYYHAPNSSELENIFARIGEDLSDIHLSM